MNRTNSYLVQRGPWHQTAALLLAVVVLLACKLAEVIDIEQDGSGNYQADLTLVGEEKEMLREVKGELANKPRLKIIEEGPRGDDYFIVVEMPFESVVELNDDHSTYAWEVSEAGAFTRRARLVVTNRGENQDGVTEHRLSVVMPGKVVDSNAEEVSGKTVVWDRLAAGRSGELYVDAQYLELPAGYRTKIEVAGLILGIGVVLLVALRLRRRRRS